MSETSKNLSVPPSFPPCALLASSNEFCYDLSWDHDFANLAKFFYATVSGSCNPN